MNTKVIAGIVVVVAVLIGFRFFVASDSPVESVDDTSEAVTSSSTPSDVAKPAAQQAQSANNTQPVATIESKPAQPIPDTAPEVSQTTALSSEHPPVMSDDEAKALESMHQIDDLSNRELTPEEKAAIESITADLGQNPEIDPSIDHRFNPAVGEGPVETPYTGPAPEDSMPSGDADVTPPGM